MVDSHLDEGFDEFCRVLEGNVCWRQELYLNTDEKHVTHEHVWSENVYRQRCRGPQTQFDHADLICCSELWRPETQTGCTHFTSCSCTKKRQAGEGTRERREDYGRTGGTGTSAVRTTTRNNKRQRRWRCGTSAAACFVTWLTTETGNDKVWLTFCLHSVRSVTDVTFWDFLRELLTPLMWVNKRSEDKQEIKSPDICHCRLTASRGNAQRRQRLKEEVHHHGNTRVNINNVVTAVTWAQWHHDSPYMDQSVTGDWTAPQRISCDDLIIISVTKPP